MSKHQPWLEPIRSAAIAVLSNPPLLIEWENGEDEGEVISHEIEQLLAELDWPNRTKTFTLPVTVWLKSDQIKFKESTSVFSPASWLCLLEDHVTGYVKTRDAVQAPKVPDRLRLRKLPQNTNIDALRNLIDDAWADAWDELACSVSVMAPDDAIGMDIERYQFAVYLWYGRKDGFGREDGSDTILPYEEQLRRDETKLFPSLRDLKSPKWRAWFLDTCKDRVEDHHVTTSTQNPHRSPASHDLEKSRRESNPIRQSGVRLRAL